MSPLATACDTHKVLVPDGERCPACVASDDRRRYGKRRAHGRHTPQWRRRRARKLRRDPLCELEVDDGCTVEATTVHVPAEYGGDHEACPDDELVSACKHCHGVKDGPRAAGARL